jgi:TPR repeat protein
MSNNSAVERANAAYANQEIYQSAAEIPASSSLRAIAAEVDQTAADMDSDALLQQHNALQQRQQTGGHFAADAGAGQTSPPMGRGPFDTMQSYSGSLGGHQQPQGAYDSTAYGVQQSWNGVDGHYYDDGQGHQYGRYDPSYANQQAQPGAYFNMGMGSAHAGPSAQAAQHQMLAYATQPTHGNPYVSAAQGFLDYPGATSAGSTPYSPYGGMDPLARNASVSGGSMMPGLARQGTQMSMASARSSNSALASRRRSSKDAGLRAQQQSLPFNKAFVDEYRHRMKKDPDPEAQFAYARYLIEAAKKVVDPKDGPKQARKYRDNLLSESLKLVKRLATTGMGLGKPPYAEAQFFLANCFGNGSLGLQVDHEKAYNLYVQASKQNHAAATYRTAVCNEVGAGTRRDHHRAVLFYRKASALGDTAGMYKLGMILLNGLLGQPRNIREAIVWLKRAAGQADEDNPHALHELGLLYEKPNNNIVTHDEGHARELFTQAAQLGYAPSQFKLGSAYEYGTLTCPVDPRRSIAWYTKAAVKSDGESELALSGWYLTGSEGVLKQSDSEAYLWARRAATKGIPKAEYAVGYYSEVGIGVEANIEEAKRWYMRAAAQGNKRAMMRLTELKQQKDGRGGRKGARPTRKDAETECVIA